MARVPTTRSASFWTTLPGLLTAVATLLTAVIGMLAFLSTQDDGPTTAVLDSGTSPPTSSAASGSTSAAGSDGPSPSSSRSTGTVGAGSAPGGAGSGTAGETTGHGGSARGSGDPGGASAEGGSSAEGSGRAGSGDGRASGGGDTAVVLSSVAVEDVEVRADPFAGPVPCPVDVVFSGRISLSGGGGVVEYRWERSDGASARLETLEFDGPGSKEVSTTWSRWGETGDVVDGWQRLTVVKPQRMASGQASFQLTCA